MTDGDFVDLVTGFRVRFFCVEDLLDGDRPHCVFAIVTLSRRKKVSKGRGYHRLRENTFPPAGLLVTSPCIKPPPSAPPCAPYEVL